MKISSWYHDSSSSMTDEIGAPNFGIFFDEL